MTDLTPVATLSAVPQLETNTIALAGTGNPMNSQAQALLNRDAYRGEQIESLSTDLALISDPQNGAEEVGFRGRTVSAKLKDSVSPFDHGAVGNFTTDDTAAVMAAFAEAKARRVPLKLDGDFGVSHLDFSGMNGMTIECSGTLTGRSTGSYESVLTIRNSADVGISGRLVVNGSYNPGYACGIAMYTDNGSQCSIMDIHGVSVVYALIGWKIGRLSEPDALISEITFFGGHLDGVPTCYELVGTQTVISFVGVNMISGAGAPPPESAAAWAAQPRTVVMSIGAGFTIDSGETLIVEVETGLMFDLRPIASPQPSIGNRYGNAVIKPTTVECASQLAKMHNPAGITGLLPGIGYFLLSDCQGYHGRDLFAFIEAADDFPGRIVLGPTGIFSNTNRTNATVSVGASLCDIWISPNSFSKGFINNDSGVLGGKLHHDYRTVLNASNTGGETLVANTQKKLIWTSVSAAGDLGRDSSRYSTTTGVFTVGPEGLLDAELFVKVRLSSLSASADFAVFVNGSFFTGTPRYAGDGVTGIHQSSIQLGDIAAGAAIDIRITASADCTVNFGSFEFMKINART